MNIRSILLVICFFLFGRFESVAQNINDDALFDKVEELIIKKKENYARLLLQNALASYNDTISTFSYRNHFAKGLLLYVQCDYINSVSEF